jgi:hypothetical protein
MRIRSTLFGGTLVLFWTLHASATIRYVNANNPTPSPPYIEWSSAATVIQDAIDIATPGDTVLVTNGVYSTGGGIVSGSMFNRVMVNKSLTVQSANGPAVTVIEGYQLPGVTNGDGAIRCVYLTNNATLIGFTLTGGATRGGNATSNERRGGGVFCRSSSVVSNCVIVGNAADLAGGGASGGKLFDCILTGNSSTNGGGVTSATLSNCFLSGNTARSGGGAYNCTLTSCTLSNNSAQAGGGSWYGTLANCTLIANSAGSQGGGAYFSTATNCTITGNTAFQGGGVDSATVYNSVLMNNTAGNRGGGACNGYLYNSAVTGNSASTGGGTYNVTAYNCTLTGNDASLYGGGASGGVLNNCIIYFNTATRDDGDNHSIYSNPSTLRFCCTTPVLGGTGNFEADPKLAGGFHLSADSPCRAAGNPAYATGKDIDGQSWFDPPSVGCDEFHAGTATGDLTVSIKAAYTNTAPGFSVDLVGHISGWATASRWEFGDGTVVSNSPHTSHAWLAPGDYSVVLRAYNESNPSGIAATSVVHVATEVHYVAIDCSTPLFPYESWTTAATNIQDAVDAAVLPGALVLVSNGVYQTGGRVVYGALTNRVAVTKPLVLQSVNGPGTTIISGSQTTGTDWSLGDSSVRCVYLTNAARLIGFTLTNGGTRTPFSGDSRTEASGGGLWCESRSAVASNCVLTGNAAYYGGGAAFGRLIQCTLINNHAASDGGGGHVVALDNCSVMSNSAGSSGGGVDAGVLNNCVLANNTASMGGGTFQTTLKNCTLVGNSASSFGGGAFSGALYNCIAYDNTASAGSNYHSGTLSNCCTVPLPPGGMANFTNPPLFVDMVGGNLRLQSNSPCIDSGNNLFVSSTTDLDGRPRIVNSVADIGAYEFQGAGMSEFIAWLQQHSLFTDGSADFVDSDGDSLNNWQEWIARTDPTSILSLLRVESLSATNNPLGLTITWKSVSGTMYYLQRGSTPHAVSIIQSNITGQTNTTSFTDTTVTNGNNYFYRVGVQK